MELARNVVVLCPGAEEVAEVDGCSEEHAAGNPAVDPVEALVGGSRDVADQAAFAS